ncbi:hypothetical protein [Algoriphagus litoralis]|uniref:hypothetical protein n=1 Tax=Algoriphagus litoralis TaxID=2202829 RepID=UPI000DBA0C92|nr:hypothetical protein [Algoriphagus litoralis]
MKLKAFKIWLFLLPIVGIIGILLFVQSTNNQKELELQHIRSISSLSKDIQTALPDYLKRVEGYLLREAFLRSPNPIVSENAKKVQGILAGFRPKVSNLRILEAENLPDLEFILDSTQVKVKNQPVEIPALYRDDFWQAVLNNPRYSGRPTQSSVVLMDLDIPISELFGKLIANDFTFEKFYLTNSKGTIIFPKESVGNLLFEPKPLSRDTTGISHSGITISKIFLDGREFKAYANPIYLGPNRLYFVGLYDTDYFQTVGLRINFNLLSTLLFTLILLIASVPILAVVKMGRGDQMTQSRIIHVGLSLMTIAVMMGFMLSFSKNRPIPEKILKNEIQNSAQSLKSNLNQFESLSKFWYDPFGIRIPAYTNELIQIDYATGFVKKMSFHLKNGSDPIYIQFQDNPSFIYLSERDYFKYYVQREKKSTFLDSHYSRGTGELESVIAYQDLQAPVRDINAVTFSLKIDPKLDQDHRILLIKEDGKVIFKSKKVESLVSNLSESINPNKWKEVSSLIKNNREIPESTILHVPLYLNGHQYDAIFRRIETSDYDQILWQVFLVNTNLFHAFSALTTLEGIIFLSFYFFFFLFTLFAQWSTRSGSSSKGFKSFLFEWLVPNEKNRPRLNYLMLGYLLIFAVLCWILISENLNPISTLALLIFTSLNISLVNLASAQLAEIRLTRKVSVELIVLAGIYLVVLVVVLSVFTHLIPGMIILFVSSLLIVLGWAFLQPRKSSFAILNLLKSPRSTLSAYLVLWFFLIGFLPGYLIQSKTQQFESAIWKHTEASAHEIGPVVGKYELTRRNMMAAISDPFDPKIQNFISADQHVIQKAWEGTSTGFSSNPVWYFAFGFLVLITFIIIRWIQNSIFFNLKPSAKISPDPENHARFICCINSTQIPPADPNTVEIDFKFQKFSEEYISPLKHYRFINFHCAENPYDLIQTITQLRKVGKSLTIYSGTLWKSFFAQLKSDREKSVFSEAFADFKFSVIEIEDIEKGPLKNEEEVLARLKRNKGFYANIWSDLSFEEKLVCASYAKEGFFNPARKDTMSDLAQKGIIVPRSYAESTDGWIEWRLFSSVFRLYILKHFTEEEEASFGAYEKKYGNVRTIQTAVISFVLICVALVGLFDKTFFNEAYAYLTGGLGIMGTLYSFLNQGFAGLKGFKKEG